MKSKGRVFLLDDDELILSMLTRMLESDGYEVHPESKTDNVINKIKFWSPDVVLLDIRLPEQSGIDILEEIKTREIDTQVIMLTADDTAETAVKAMKLGAEDYLTKPFNQDEVKIVINNALEKGNLKHEVRYLRKAYSEFFERDFIGESSAIKEIISKIEKMALAHVSTILVTGESGTGKEVVARKIHHLMFDSDSSGYAPFISINCAAMPETLLESELFGYEKGSFTDARAGKKGLFESAKGGSVLLDEIGDMNPSLQSKLLRVMEERTIRRIGGKEDIPVDVTVIATTNRNLSDAVKKNEFRKDLFFRLSTFYLHILPLRERSEDIPTLVKHFMSYFATKYNKTVIEISPEAEKLIVSYNWPGNVRELKNLIERFVVLENTDVILPEHLPRWLLDQSTTADQKSEKKFVLPASGLSLDEVEKDLILQALEKAKNNRAEAARLLNISYDTLRYQLKKFGLK
jgi:DNA-binding NtrC family response regulator